jgi:hypothetical protein
LKPEREKIAPTMIIQEIVTSERSQTIQLKQSAERLFDLETFEKVKITEIKYTQLLPK